MRQGLSEIVLLLDRSGSMSSTKDDAEGGLKEFIARQRVLPGDCRLTFYRFDTEIERVFEDRPLRDVRDEELRLEPRGMTALLDTLNRAIDEVGARLARHADYDRPEHVYVVVITDGQENASSVSRSVVFEKIARQRNQYQWQFVFIGANQDAITEAGHLGIDPQFALSYSGTGKGTLNAYNALNNTISHSRVTGEAVCFSASDRSSAAEE